jgi:hypothetical protein
MPTISIFTPSHDARWLPELWDSIKLQSHQDFEWVVLCNGNASYSNDDRRVKIYHDSSPGPRNVGYVKREACRHCAGDILLECDQDDLLLPGALEEAVKAFNDPNVDFVFSNNINWDFRSNKPMIFPEHFGWKYRDVVFQGMACKEAIAPLPEPQNLSRVWYAPDHFRAWRREFYWRIGGHDPAMRVCDDHDLICRTYIEGKMAHVDCPFYFYRIHGGNSWLQFNGEIQTATMALHDKYIEPMAQKWAKTRGLRCIDLCGGIDSPAGYESVDTHHADVIANLEQRWPFEDNSIGVIRAHDAIEHLRDPIHTMNEAWRVLAHGGFLFIQVPSSEGVGAHCDPTHRSFWNARSFRYYTEEKFQRYIRHAGAQCRFQQLKIQKSSLYEDQVPYVIAHLIALKEPHRTFHGEVLI